MAEEHGRYYTAREIADLARDAGFRDDRPSGATGTVAGLLTAHTKASELAVSVAIALAESGGDSLAEGPPIEQGTAKGLWQIYPAGSEMFDPVKNAETAWAKYEGAGRQFTPWSTFTNKSYLVKLPIAEAAVRATHHDRPGVTRPSAWPGVGGILDFTGNIAHDVATFFAWITSGQTWIRLGEVLGGAVLLLFALYLLLSKTEVGKDVKKVATKGAL